MERLRNCILSLLFVLALLPSANVYAEPLTAYSAFLACDSVTQNSIYGFSLPGVSDDFPDEGGRVLTDGQYAASGTAGMAGVTITSQESFQRMPSHFFMDMDLRGQYSIHGITASFVRHNSVSLPDKVEFYGSSDGYSYTYLGEGGKLYESGNSLIYGVLCPVPHIVKAVKVVVFAPENATIGMDEIDVRGEALTEAVPLHGTMTEPTAGTQIIDLETIRHISEVAAQVSGNQIPHAFHLYTSEDGVTYKEFGTAYRFTAFWDKGLFQSIFRAGKPYTVAARYVKILSSETNGLVADNVQVYSFLEEISQVLLPPSESISSYTNVAKGCTVSAGGIYRPKLTDGKHNVFNSTLMWENLTPNLAGTVTLDIDLGTVYTELCGLTIETQDSTDVPWIEIQTSSDGQEYTSQGFITDSALTAEKRLYRAEFDAVPSQYVRLIIRQLTEAIQISEIEVYNGMPHRPLVRGGWLAMPVDDFSGSFHTLNNYTENEWEALFYSMRRNGMDYAVLGNIANAATQKTWYPNPTAEGYSYAGTGHLGYAAEDQLESLLTAADKAGIKVFIGSHINIGVLFENYYQMSSVQRDIWMENHINEGNQIYRDVIARYSEHESFYGFYLADETCDYWLRWNNGQGVTEARKRYEGQSRLLRELAPDKKIMIAPAIWHTLDYNVTPAEFAADMTALVQQGDNAKPIVDIVALQDCLGRQAVTSAMFSRYEESLDAVTEAIRNLDIEAWNDTEIFNPQFTGPQPFDNILHSLSLSMKQSNTSLVFDIVHYFDGRTGHLIEPRRFETDYIMREYGKYADKYVQNVQTTFFHPGETFTDELNDWQLVHDKSDGWQIDGTQAALGVVINKSNNNDGQYITYKTEGLTGFRIEAVQFSAMSDPWRDIKAYVSEDGQSWQETFLHVSFPHVNSLLTDWSHVTLSAYGLPEDLRYLKIEMQPLRINSTANCWVTGIASVDIDVQRSSKGIDNFEDMSKPWHQSNGWGRETLPGIGSFVRKESNNEAQTLIYRINGLVSLQVDCALLTSSPELLGFVKASYSENGNDFTEIPLISGLVYTSPLEGWSQSSLYAEGVGSAAAQYVKLEIESLTYQNGANPLDNCYGVGFTRIKINNVITTAPKEIKSQIHQIVPGFILGIDENTPTDTFADAFNNTDYLVLSEADGVVKTGMTVAYVVGGHVISIHTAVVTWDVSGNGQVNAQDIVLMKQAVLGVISLEPAHQKAADPNQNGLDIIDLVNIKKYTVNR